MVGREEALIGLHRPLDAAHSQLRLAPWLLRCGLGGIVWVGPGSELQTPKHSNTNCGAPFKVSRTLGSIAHPEKGVLFFSMLTLLRAAVSGGSQSLDLGERMGAASARQYLGLKVQSCVLTLRDGYRLTPPLATSIAERARGVVLDLPMEGGVLLHCMLESAEALRRLPEAAAVLPLLPELKIPPHFEAILPNTSAISHRGNFSSR